MFNNLYKGKTVFITGHRGFKGTWLTLWLNMLGAKVIGYSLVPNCDYSAFDILKLSDFIDKEYIEDIRDYNKLQQAFEETNPEIVFHLAAQPLVRLSYSQPILTYDTNIMGTLNVLESARKTSSVKAFINITTDKCYENQEKNIAYKENDPMGGYDMYSSSKACSELLTSSYRRSFLLISNTYALASARAGNVIGGGDWSLDRLIPDCIRCIESKKEIIIRNPNSIRPWQFVLEPLAGYLQIGANLLTNKDKYSGAYNLGPNLDSCINVKSIVEKVINFYENGEFKILNNNSDLHEAKLLMLDNKKAKEMLGIEPILDISSALQMTVDWYRNFYRGNENMLEFSKNQIATYECKAKIKKVSWSILK